jgi:hypothetical protein
MTHSGDIFVATCNCLPSEGLEESVIYCYDYQLEESGEINVEVVDRGQCYGPSQPLYNYAVAIGAVHTCSSLAETREAGLVNGNI